METEIILALSCLIGGFGLRHFLPLLKRKSKPLPHEHTFDHMAVNPLTQQGEWLCAVCEEPKEPGT